MKTLNSLLAALLLATVSLSCDDAFEEDITDDNIQIIAPTEGSTVLGNTVQFSWDPIDGADEYRIQVITLNQTYEVDSLITTSTFSYTLNPDDYQWRVKGKNFAYETAYTFPTSFSVEASEDLGTQTVLLDTPTADLYTNDPNIIFTWNQITTADSYSFELVKNLNGLETLHTEPGITSTSFSLDSTIFDEDSEYIWKVKAVNATSNTLFSERSIFIDRVIPNQPTLVSPLDLEITTTTVNFNWTNGTDTGNIQSAITNTIEISTDFNFATITETSTTANNSFQYTFNTTGTYYWRVKAKDAAANESAYSSVREIDVQ